MRVLLIFFTITFAAPAFADDPFANITHTKLNNGLDLYMAPNPEATLFKIKLIVDVGWYAESKANWGVSHLLEHVLFRDKKLPEEMSFLQLIEEHGGEANGVTSRRTTSYFGTVPKAKAPWLYKTFFHMLTQQKKILDKYVQKEKHTVLREIGEPSKISKFLNFDIFRFLDFDYLKMPDFWESEFRVSFDPPFTREQERISTLNLTREQVQKQYDNYYYPSNMHLFIAGHFDPKKLLTKVNNTWGKLVNIPHLKEKSDPVPHLRDKPFYQVVVANASPLISMGTKLWNLTFEDALVLDSYTEHLAHRLMKEIRNKYGYTYRVTAYNSFYKKYGYATVQFNTKESHFNKTRRVLRDYIKDEAQTGTVPDDEIDEAIKLYLNAFDVQDSDAHTLLARAEDFYYIYDTYGIEASPYATLKKIDHAKYNEILKKNFTPQRNYTYLKKPTFGFSWDYVLFALISFALMFRRFRIYLTKKFNHTHLRWMRKIQYAPFNIVQILITLLAVVIFAHVQYGVIYMLRKAPLFNRSLFLNLYVLWVASAALVAVAIQSAYALFPRKLMVADGMLYIKSLTYFSRTIPLTEISSVQALSLWRVLFSWSTLKQIKWRFFFLDLFFWRKSLILRLKNGRAYLFSFRDASKVVNELNLSFLHPH